MDNEKIMAEKEYAKKYFRQKEEECIAKATKIFMSIEKDLDAIKGLKDYEKKELLSKIKSYEAYSVEGFGFFMRSKYMD